MYRPHALPPCVPGETNLMYMDKAAANVEIVVPERLEHFQEQRAVVDDQPVHADRPRQEVRLPTWQSY